MTYGLGKNQEKKINVSSSLFGTLEQTKQFVMAVTSLLFQLPKHLLLQCQYLVIYRYQLKPSAFPTGIPRLNVQKNSAAICKISTRAELCRRQENSLRFRPGFLPKFYQTKSSWLQLQFFIFLASLNAFKRMK